MNRQRFLIPGLIVLAVVLGIVSFVLVNKNQNVTNTNVPAGQVFGISTDKTTLDKINSGLKTIKCSNFLSTSLIKPSEFNKTDPMHKTLWATFSIDDLAKYDLSPVNCSYYLANNIKVKFIVYTYNKDSQIPTDKIGDYNNLIATSLSKVIENGDNDSDHSFKYTYGTDKNNNKICKTQFIHSTNDLNYGEITYQNLGACDSNDNIQINKTIFSTITKQLGSTLTNLIK